MVARSYFDLTPARLGGFLTTDLRSRNSTGRDRQAAQRGDFRSLMTF